MMNLTQHIAKHFRDVHFGSNWTDVNLKDTLTGVTFEQAVYKVEGFNTIAALVFHINYYVSEVLKVLDGAPLTASDKYSFPQELPKSTIEWENLVQKTFADAELFATAIERLDEIDLFKDFADPKYGSYYRNIHGIIEHTHYHLGQIALIKKLICQSQPSIGQSEKR